jgi:hypothetical protein
MWAIRGVVIASCRLTSSASVHPTSNTGLQLTSGRSRCWRILGANPSLADINLMPLAARLDYLGLLELWIKDRPRVNSWWDLAHEWPSFKSGLRDLISEAEFSEMKTHGPKIANDVAAIIADVRRNMLASSVWKRSTTIGHNVRYWPKADMPLTPTNV